MPLTAAAIGGIAAAAGTAASSIGSTIYGTERNIANSNYQAQLQREFEERMASTQYQRAVNDMKAAGLNPAAIGSGMSSDAVPSGAAATGNYGHGGFADFSNIFSSAVSAAMARDKNVSNKVMQEMKDETALQVQNLRNQGKIQNEIQKKELGHSAYRVLESKSYKKYANPGYDITSKHRQIDFDKA